MTVVMLVSLILTIAMAYDNAKANQVAKNKTSKITKEATALAEQISKDRKLANDLLNAYNRKDYRLASSMLGYSPFGTAFRKFREAIKINDDNIINVGKKMSNIDAQEQKINAAVNEASTKSQTSGSHIVDLIHGGSKDNTELPTYNTQFSEPVIKEENK